MESQKKRLGALGGAIDWPAAVPTEQPGGHQGGDGKHRQLDGFRNVSSLDPTATDPAAGQGRNPKDQGRFGGKLPPAYVGPQVGQGQQCDHQQREGNGLAGGKGGATHQQRQKQDGATGTEHREQETDQAAAGSQQCKGATVH